MPRAGRETAGRVPQAENRAESGETGHSGTSTTRPDVEFHEGVDPGDRRSAATLGEADRRGRASKRVERVEKRRDVALRPERLGRPEKTEKTAMENGNRLFHKPLRELLCGMQGRVRSCQGIGPAGRRRRRARTRRDEPREDRRRTPVHHAMLEPRVQGDSVYTGRGKERVERRQRIRFSGHECAAADRLIGGRERLGERAERRRRLLRRCLQGTVDRRDGICTQRKREVRTHPTFMHARALAWIECRNSEHDDQARHQNGDDRATQPCGSKDAHQTE